MAEGILKKALVDRGADNVEVGSAGTLGIIDSPATPLAVEVARSFSIDISSHLSREFTPELAGSSDLILALSTEHYKTAVELGAPEEKVYMLKVFPRRTKDLRAASIRDPIGGDMKLYQRAFLEIDEALQQGAGEIMRMAGVAGKQPPATPEDET